MKILVGIPAYDGKLHCETARSLIDEISAASLAGVHIEVRFAPGNSLITMARNQLAAEFIESDADKMVFIDSDVAWEVGCLLKLASHKADFVSGAYRLKQAGEAYPIGWLERDELWAENGLLEVATVPGGFLCLTREVFDTIRHFHHYRQYSHYDWRGYAYFAAPYENGKLYGEDAWFCEQYRKAGGKVWLDPELTLTHVGGNNKFTGNIGDWLRRRMDDHTI